MMLKSPHNKELNRKGRNEIYEGINYGKIKKCTKMLKDYFIS